MSFTTEQRAEGKECLINFLDAINNRQFKEAKKFTQITWLSVRQKPHRYIERMFGVTDFVDVKITATTMPSPGVVVLDVHFTTKDGKWKARLIPETDPYKAAWDGKWGVVPHSIQRKG